MLELSLRSREYNQKNPARGLIEDGAPEFGLTVPRYNGQSAYMQRGLGSTLAPIQVGTATLHGTTDQQVPSTYKHKARLLPARHEIEWDIQLPPFPHGGRWENACLNGQILWAWLDAFAMRFPGNMLNGTDQWLKQQRYRTQFYNVRPWILRLIPKPTPQLFMNHVLAHELQHMEDHAWLACAIFGPLDEWQAERRDDWFVAHDRASLYGLPLAGYAETAERIVRYWQQACVTSGDLYHGSVNGASPRLDVVRIESGEVDIDVTPIKCLPYPGFDLDDPRPHCHPQVFRITGRKIGGQEERISYVNAQTFRPRSVRHPTDDFQHLGVCYHGVDQVDSDDEPFDLDRLGNL